MKRTATPFDGFGQFFGQLGRGFELMAPGDGSAGMAVANNGDEFVQTADLPGFDREEIDIE